MNTNSLAIAVALSDEELLTRILALAGTEREATSELVAHLAALDSRPAAYAAKGYGSLFAYCIEALRLSEDAACNRIEAARACRRFPVILDLLASGSLTLASVRLLARHLTTENHQAVLARARGRRRREIESLIAELAPRPDVPTTVRKLPVPPTIPSSMPSDERMATGGPVATLFITPQAAAPLPARRSVVQATAPQRYRVQLTIDQDTHDKLRRLQMLLRREIPDGDAGAIFAQAISLLLEKVERAKLGRADRPRPRREPVIRPETDDDIRPPGLPSRAVPAEVKRVVWRRDGGQCDFVSADGHRCTETAYLELHHVLAYAKRGGATAANIAIRCRRHNQYEAELVFGPRTASPSPSDS